MSRPKILHVVPDSLLVPRNAYLGSTKDIRCRTEYFKARGMESEELHVQKRSDAYLTSAFRERDLSVYTAVFYEMPLYPRSMAYVRKHYPGLRQITRSIEATFYHQLQFYWLEQLYAERPFSPRLYRHHIKRLQYAFRRLQLDYACGRQSDFMLAIVDWESRNYWRYLMSADRILTLPYFVADEYETEIDSRAVKKDQCICLMSSTTATAPFLQESLFNYSELVRKLGSDAPEWHFLVSGELSDIRFDVARRIERTGFLESPFPKLVESRALAMLSNYGLGFKTKLLDALQANCYLFVPKKSYEELPAEIKPYCMVVDLASAESFKTALERSRDPMPKGNPNAALKSKAYAILDKVLIN